MGKDSRDLPGQALLDAAWFDPIEVMVRDRVRGFIENLVEAELDDALGRSRYQRPGTANVGERYGRLSAWAASTPTAWFVWRSDDPGTARAAERRSWDEPRMAQ